MTVIQKSRESFLNRSFVYVSLLLSVSLILFVFYVCQFGLEFTDEGFYLNWIADPFAFKISTTHFGFIYHPLYLFLNGNVILMRQVNLFVLMGLSWCLFSQVFSFITAKLLKLTASLGFAISVFLFLQLWLPTPNYNSLNLFSFLIFGNAILLIEKDAEKFRVVGSILIGLAGYFSFMAKPPSAAFLAVLTFIYFLSLKKGKFSSLFIAGITALTSVLVTAWIIDGSVKIFFFERIVEGANSVQVLGGGHSPLQMFRVGSVGLSWTEKCLSLGLLVLLAAPQVIDLTIKGKEFFGILFALVSLVLGGLVPYLFPNSMLGSERVGVLIFVPLLGLLFVFARNFKRTVFSSRFFWISSLFLFLPYAYSFGSNNNYWLMSTGAGLFGLVGGVLLLRDSEGVLIKYLWPILGIIQLVVAVNIYAATKKPYRQPQALWANEEQIEVRGHIFSLDKDSANYIQAMSEAASLSGFIEATPFIDMTGHYPTLAYVLRAKSLGHPWLLGGYPGSLDYIEAGLKQAKCSEVGKAWVLVEEEGPRAVPISLISSYGLNLSDDYIAVGSFPSLLQEYSRVYKHTLYKPKSDLEQKVKNSGKCLK